jgi:glucosamine--fructose-6-phosphate aminotransferase (isomerizing)
VSGLLGGEELAWETTYRQPAVVSAFDSDIAEQSAALRNLVEAVIAHPLRLPDVRGFDRVVLTGMGTSHHSALPSWRHLVAARLPAWWLSTAALLDSPQLITDRTLLVITSQSGRSGELIALLQRLETDIRRPRLLIGITNDATSPLASAGDLVLELMAGVESAVSTKSYLNSLAAHHLLFAGVDGGSTESTYAAVRVAARELEPWSPSGERLNSVAARIVQAATPRVVLIGSENQVASVSMGALLLKEVTKLPAESFIGGEFRHGPLELAGPGLVAVVFTGSGGRTSLSRLADDVGATGSLAVEVGAAPSSTAEPVVTPATHELSQLAMDAKFIQLLCAATARAAGVTPGEFRFGQKVTSQL